MADPLTIATITKEALAILNKVFDETYENYERRRLGGNEAVHQLVPIQLYNESSEVDAGN